MHLFGQSWAKFVQAVWLCISVYLSGYLYIYVFIDLSIRFFYKMSWKHSALTTPISIKVSLVSHAYTVIFTKLNDYGVLPISLNNIIILSNRRILQLLKCTCMGWKGQKLVFQIMKDGQHFQFIHLFQVLLSDSHFYYYSWNPHWFIVEKCGTMSTVLLCCIQFFWKLVYRSWI